jgi:hypothetical protein
MKIGQKDAESTATFARFPAAARGPSVETARPRLSPGEDHRVGMARVMLLLVGKVDDVTPSPARAAHLALLRNAVAAGRYQPDLHEVARKLLLEAAAEQVG